MLLSVTSNDRWNVLLKVLCIYGLMLELNSEGQLVSRSRVENPWSRWSPILAKVVLSCLTRLASWSPSLTSWKVPKTPLKSANRTAWQALRPSNHLKLF